MGRALGRACSLVAACRLQLALEQLVAAARAARLCCICAHWQARALQASVHRNLCWTQSCRFCHLFHTRACKLAPLAVHFHRRVWSAAKDESVLDLYRAFQSAVSAITTDERGCCWAASGALSGLSSPQGLWLACV